MALLKFVAAVLLALSAVALAANSGKNLLAISEQLKRAMNETLSEEDRADAKKAFSFAIEHNSELKGSGKQISDKLLTAWDQVLHHPDSCNELSLGYIDLIYNRLSMMEWEIKLTLRGPIKEYARNCLTPEYIKNMIKLRAGRIFEINLDFVDDQFIADYWSKKLKFMKYTDAYLERLPGAIIKAINRGREKNIEVPRTEAQLHAYLNERLYKPCTEYEKALKGVMRQIRGASEFLQGGFGELYERLDEDMQRVSFRYEVCKYVNRPMLDGWPKMEARVSSRLTGLAAVGQSVAAWTSRIFNS